MYHMIYHLHKSTPRAAAKRQRIMRSDFRNFTLSMCVGIRGIWRMAKYPLESQNQLQFFQKRLKLGKLRLEPLRSE